MFDASCISEYYVHAGILGSFLSFLAYVLMNISRIVFLRGLRRMFWSHFSTGDFSYLATANEHGEAEYPSRVVEEGISMKEAVRDELHETLKKFQKAGIYLCIIALLINFPWVAILLRTQDGLKFDSQQIQSNGN